MAFSNGANLCKRRPVDNLEFRCIRHVSNFGGLSGQSNGLADTGSCCETYTTSMEESFFDGAASRAFILFIYLFYYFFVVLDDDSDEEDGFLLAQKSPKKSPKSVKKTPRSKSPSQRPPKSKSASKVSQKASSKPREEEKAAAKANGNQSESESESDSDSGSESESSATSESDIDWDAAGKAYIANAAKKPAQGKSKSLFSSNVGKPSDEANSSDSESESESESDGASDSSGSSSSSSEESDTESFLAVSKSKKGRRGAAGSISAEDLEELIDLDEIAETPELLNILQGVGTDSSEGDKGAKATFATEDQVKVDADVLKFRKTVCSLAFLSTFDRSPFRIVGTAMWRPKGDRHRYTSSTVCELTSILYNQRLESVGLLFWRSEWYDRARFCTLLVWSQRLMSRPGRAGAVLAPVCAALRSPTPHSTHTREHHQILVRRYRVLDIDDEQSLKMLARIFVVTYWTKLCF